MPDDNAISKLSDNELLAGKTTLIQRIGPVTGEKLSPVRMSRDPPKSWPVPARSLLGKYLAVKKETQRDNQA